MRIISIQVVLWGLVVLAYGMGSESAGNALTFCLWLMAALFFLTMFAKPTPGNFTKPMIYAVRLSWVALILFLAGQGRFVLATALFIGWIVSVAKIEAARRAK